MLLSQEEYTRLLRRPEPQQMSDDEWYALLDEVGSELNPSTPLLGDEAVSRESFYAERP